MGVIGVLFALIIPFITSAYKKNLVSHRLQKFYNIFNGALELSKAENGDPLEWTYCFSDDCLSTKSQTEFFNTYIFAYMIGLEKCSIGGKCANIKVPNEISQGDANASSWFRYVFADGSCFGIKLGGITNDKVFRTIDLLLMIKLQQIFMVFLIIIVEEPQILQVRMCLNFG